MPGGVVVLGAGHAAGRFALLLRKFGWQEPISLVGDEIDPPYERPPLSKEVLHAGADPLIQAVGNAAQFADLNVDLILGSRATSIDLAAQNARLADGRCLAYDKLVIATGTRANRLPFGSGDAENCFYLRTAADARRLAVALRPGSDVVLIGSGFISLEVASSATARGCEVSIVGREASLLRRVLEPEVAAHLASLHVGRGVHLHLQRRVVRLECRGERIERVVLDDGRKLSCDTLVVGIGALVNQELALEAGIACDDGILVDSCCRTSVPNVYAIGDVTRHRNEHFPGQWRLESWENAELQASVLAKIMNGVSDAYSCVPWFWTDQYALNVQVLGVRRHCEQTVVRGDPASGQACFFHLSAGRVVSAVMFNAGRERKSLRKLISDGLSVRPEALADESVSLRSLVNG